MKSKKYLVLAALPILAGMVLKILTNVPAEGISITGAHIYFTIPMPLQDLPITEAQVNSWLVIASLFFLCRYLTSGLTVRGGSVRQMLAEWIVEKTEGLVMENMGSFFEGFAPFVGAILGLSALSSLLTLVGLFPPTSDLNISAGWALAVFILITHYKLKGGLGNYLKGFAEPIPVMLPMNIIGELATPVAMAFRHYGNILSGMVISVLVSAALQGLSKLFLPVPLLQIGLPAVLSIYFDVFSGCLQAFIFAMLTMLNISSGFPAEEYEKRQKRKTAEKARI